METATVADCRVEVGANFLSSTYCVIPRMAERLGVALRPIRARAGVIVDSQAVTYVPNGFAMVQAGVMGWREAAQAGWQLARQFPRLAKANPADLAQWADIDVPADAWCSGRFGEAFTRAVIGSSFRGYYFQDLAQTSASAALAMVSYGSRPFTTLTADPGLEAIPRRWPRDCRSSTRLPSCGSNATGPAARWSSPTGRWLRGIGSSWPFPHPRPLRSLRIRLRSKPSCCRPPIARGS